MPKNLEIKARISDVQRVISCAQNLQAIFKGELHQVDTYFNVPQGRLKLREILPDHSELIYYLRQEESPLRLSEFEIYPVENVVQLKNILSDSIGIKTIVEKKRLLFLYKNTRIHIDEVGGLGTFLEFETKIHGSENHANDELNDLIEKFNLCLEDCIYHSYVDLMISHVANTGKAIKHIF